MPSNFSSELGRSCYGYRPHLKTWELRNTSSTIDELGHMHRCPVKNPFLKPRCYSRCSVTPQRWYESTKRASTKRRDSCVRALTINNGRGSKAVEPSTTHCNCCRHARCYMHGPWLFYCSLLSLVWFCLTAIVRVVIVLLSAVCRLSWEADRRQSSVLSCLQN